ncbi:dTDP-4-dehydrorhamnose reductase [Maribacter thermophilus]|uniref:dTDP-4-dehydrorhamnose reductase n=1 Tax=Maribacter thermophilus TaxID=1197874 RepID=UPI0006411569|nr:dTDP-4-dehydrorhamnose reductase [Maribacter thermophilus]
MKSVLVTGANGQLGRSIRDIVADYPDLQVTFKGKDTFDIANDQEVKNTFDSYKYDYCINCAAYTNVEQAEINPELAYKINTEGAKNLALACKDHKTVLIHISTDYVFDGTKSEPYTIIDEPNPINEYGKSKLEGEVAIQEILNEFFIVRTSWLYHKVHGKNFYKSIMEKARLEEVLQVTDAQKGCPTNASNLARYILELIAQNNKAYGILHYTDNEAMTWYDFAKRILEENNLSHKVQLEKAKNYRTFAIRPENSILKS